MSNVWLARDPWADIYAKITATYSQNAFRFRNDDGTETSATWLAAENTNITGVDIASNVHLRVRLAMQETAGGAENNVDITLQYRVNGGLWTNVSGSTTHVTYVTSTFVANGTATTDQLATPTGTFLPGSFISVDASAARTTFAGNDHTEIEYSLNLLAADLVHGDVIEFRTLANGAVLTTYSHVPSVTVAISVPTTAPVLSSPSKTTTSINLDWTTANGATSYELQRNGVTIYSGPNLSFNDTGLTPNTSYTYRVRGVNDTGPGPWSTELAVTTVMEAFSGVASTQVNVTPSGTGATTRSGAATPQNVSVTPTVIGRKNSGEAATPQSVTVTSSSVISSGALGTITETITVTETVASQYARAGAAAQSVTVTNTTTEAITRSGIATPQNVSTSPSALGRKNGSGASTSQSVTVTTAGLASRDAFGIASETVNVSIAIEGGKFKTPIGLQAERTGSEQITLTWSPTAGATSYVLGRQTFLEPDWLDEELIEVGFTTQYVDLNASEISTFRYRVRAAIDY